jgi:5-methylcytosine-specific restriction protein A
MDHFAGGGRLSTLYRRLTARGGVDTFTDETQNQRSASQETIIERRRYRLHRKIDRNSRAGEAAKRVHGYKCQTCGFDFETVYGPLGERYIEAHHLTPLAQLPEDEPVPQDPDTDFAVLCANCHRMIHRKGAPETVDELRALLAEG